MTRVDLIKQALENLKVIDAIQEPAAEDAAVVGRRLNQETARLSEIGLVWWSADEIPESVAGALADLVAARCQTTFGKTYDATDAEARIAAVKSSAQNPTVRALYY